MKDLDIRIWLGLPLASLAFCLVMALIDPDLYVLIVRSHELGYLEQSTVLFLLPAVGLGGWLAWQWGRLGRPWLAVWACLLALGALYFAGEEASWGQNYFGWSTPQGWSRVNDQNETNIHNVHGVFDQLPRGLLTAAAIVSLVSAPLLDGPRRRWDASRDWRGWIMPTMAVVPAAALAVLSGLPQKLVGGYGERDPSMPAWLDQMFLRGSHSELKEHFLAMFIMLYMVSWARRFRTWRAAQVERTTESQSVSSSA